MARGWPLAARGIAENFGKAMCGEGARWVQAARGGLPVPTQGDAGWDLWVGLGPVGPEMSAAALPGGQPRLPATPRTCSSLLAAAALANIAALIHPPSSLLLLVKTTAGPTSPCPLPSPSWCHPPGVTLLVSPSWSHPPGVNLPAQSGTALGEPGVPGCPASALPTLSCSELCAPGSGVVRLGYFGVQPAPLNLPLGCGLL